MQPVTRLEEVSSNLRQFDSYRSGSPDEVAWFQDRLRLGNKFVAGQIDGRMVFAPSRVAGYSGCSMELHRLFPGKDGRVTNRAISRILGAPASHNRLEEEYLRQCREVGITPAVRHARGYWLLSPDVAADQVVRYARAGFPDEVRDFVEGATRRVIVNAYERDPKARDACISHYGYDCVVCGFNFQEVYGRVGGRFVHVHHLTPISRSGGSRKVDPVLEMRPVCANCHAMLHKADPPLTIEDLQSLLEEHAFGV